MICYTVCLSIVIYLVIPFCCFLVVRVLLFPGVVGYDVVNGPDCLCFV